jgi:hypothetical protein
MADTIITADQLAELQNKVATLVGDKGVADGATRTSNDAHAALQKAQTDVAAADTAEATADGQVNADLADLRVFIDNLAPRPAPGPVAPTGEAPIL